MTILQYKNNASSSLQSAINFSATTIILASGSGGLFPAIVAGQSFFVTLRDAATEIVNEIVLVTARTGDTLTVQRAQQGSLARGWLAGDLVDQLFTMGDAQNIVQPDQLQANLYSYAAGTGTNSITATIQSALTAIPDAMPLVIKAAAANTGSVTLTVTLHNPQTGVNTVIAAQPIKKGVGSQLNAGDIPGASYPIELIWSATLAAFIMTNANSGTTGSVSGGAANQVLAQTAPNTTGFIAAPTIAGQVLAWTGSALAWLAAAVTSFNGRSGAVMPQAGDYNPAQVGAVSVASVTGGNQQVSFNGYQYLPGGIIIQWGQVSPTADLTSVGFPLQFPNNCFVVIPTGYTNDSNSSTNLQASSYTVSGFLLRAQGNERPCRWFAIGF